MIVRIRRAAVLIESGMNLTISGMLGGVRTEEPRTGEPEFVLSKVEGNRRIREPENRKPLRGTQAMKTNTFNDVIAS